MLKIKQYAAAQVKDAACLASPTAGLVTQTNLMIEIKNNLTMRLFQITMIIVVKGYGRCCQGNYRAHMRIPDATIMVLPFIA